ncbi:peptidoglycan DD-metalloendopeptidase family protein [Marinobacter sp. X15-166B]|uniref:peptidoglycan DD-metalloendopeptidase family protein n=1 Tax=Marinobacter sp. X15-166B TaxID=1897620 RepID=UPI0009F292FF|nr:peptidoglycan DD-metalloendopeptidase family protein [Marinobacter sp. X15-166B]
MNRYRAFTALHTLTLAVCAAVLLVTSLTPSKARSTLSGPAAPGVADGEHPDSGKPPAQEARVEENRQTADHAADKTVAWQVRPGDALSRIFRAHQAPLEDLQQILLADTEYLSLETLRPGTRLDLTFDGEDRFTALTLHLDPARKVVYTRQQDGSFVHQAIEADTYWVTEVLRGTINGSFYASALRAGLSRAQILLIDQLLGHGLNFRKDLRAGDQFSVILGHEMTGEHSTGNTRIDAISLVRSSRTHNAFRFDDGNYYNEHGESVTPAFLRWPTQKPYRVSSHFNLNRLHPITGRRAPHNGVDFATPVGTPILSTGDGIVRRVGNHPYAGKYIDIDHGGTYTTRYLHLHKILVRRGVQVQRGQRIALSGNTGRSTGPHLHFEFHINGRPVDPLTAEIPTAAAIPQAASARFAAQLRERLAVMKYAGSRSDLLTAESPPLFN